MMNEAFFVYLSTVIFIVLLWKFGVFEKIVSFLENKRDEIRIKLSETDAMRKEAEALYNEYRIKMEMLEREASEILASAQKTADMMLEKTHQDIKSISERKKRELERRLSDYERSVKEELVQKYADIVIDALEQHAHKDFSVKKLDLNEIGNVL